MSETCATCRWWTFRARTYGAYSPISPEHRLATDVEAEFRHICCGPEHNTWNIFAIDDWGDCEKDLSGLLLDLVAENESLRERFMTHKSFACNQWEGRG